MCLPVTRWAHRWCVGERKWNLAMWEPLWNVPFFVRRVPLAEINACVFQMRLAAKPSIPAHRLLLWGSPITWRHFYVTCEKDTPHAARTWAESSKEAVELNCELTGKMCNRYKSWVIILCHFSRLAPWQCQAVGWYITYDFGVPMIFL